MNPFASPNDICGTCGCPRWKHHKFKTRWGYCKHCKVKNCKQFRWSPPEKYVLRRHNQSERLQGSNE